MSLKWLTSLKKPFSGGVSAKLKDLWRKDPSKEALLLALEDVLLEANFGLAFTQSVLKQLSQKQLKTLSFEAIQEELALKLETFLTPFMGDFERDKARQPFVAMLVGVNGSGKTTTAGKLAAVYQKQGARVLFASADFFRAAADQQALQWAQKVGVDFHQTSQHKDSAAFVFDAMRVAKEKAYDVLLLDTAGRLHTQKNLMEELSKLKRVLIKHDADAPHACWLVLDGTVGQNAAQQLQLFKEHLPLTGLFVTKLDGTARPGAILPLLESSGVPLVGFGCGETATSLKGANAKVLSRLMLGLEGPLKA
ncbi:MAG: AAA family ATPase [Holosporaceae bacterium]